MKKFIQISAILSLLVVFSAISASAQAVSSYKADIPFDFSIGQKSYQSGNYVIKTSKIAANAVSFTLEDEKGNKLQTILVASSEGISKNNPELVFNRYDNQRFLTGLVTTDASITLAMSGTEKRIAKEMREKGSKTQVALALGK
jgi:hypothetical protein